MQEHLKQQTLISGWPVTPGAIRKGHISEMPTNRQPGFWIAVNSGRNSPPKATFYCSKVYSA